MFGLVCADSRVSFLAAFHFLAWLRVLGRLGVGVFFGSPKAFLKI